jgi:branched-chain amino acid transport system substrate-binding protein
MAAPSYGGPAARQLTQHCPQGENTPGEPVKSHRTRALGVSVAMVATLVVAACGGSSGSGGGAIKFAVAGPMTGDASVYGLSQYNGVQLAVDEFEKAGGITSGTLKGKAITVDKLDDGYDPNQGASIAQKVCDDSHYLSIFGHSGSSVTLAASPIWERCGLPAMVSYSSSPAITSKLHRDLFQTVVNDNTLGAEMADMAKDQLKLTDVGIITTDNDYGVGVSTAFKTQAKKIGLRVVDTIATTAGQKDFTPALTSLKGKDAKAVVLLNTYTDAALQIKQARALGWDAPIFAAAGANSPSLVTIAGAKQAEGVIVAALFDPDSQEPGSAAFVKAYQAKFGEKPAESAALAYDSAFLVLNALNHGATDRKSLLDVLNGARSFEVPISGSITFDEHNSRSLVPGKPSMSLLRVTDGQLTTYTG